VVEILGRMNDPRAAEVLGTALGDAEASVRLAAITALAHGGDTLRAQRFAALAETDPDLAVRRAAQATLRR
jgi:HEAT repeat protein